MAGESGLETAALNTTATYVPPVTAGDDVALTSAAPRATDETRLLERLFAEPWSFDFFQALHLLERLQPDRSPVGAFGDPRQEAVRLTTAASVAFPASEIQSLNTETTPPRMAVNFLGLTGPQGALPLAYSLYVADRIRAGDHALKEFLGIFDHRVLSLFYRAWEKTHITVAHGEEKRDWLTRHLLDLVGLGNDALRDRLPITDQALLFYAGLLALPTRPAGALEQLLADFFGVPVKIEQFVGAWYPLERATQSELDDESESSQLGFGAVAGDEIWDQQSRARVRIGPLTRRQYDDFLPGGSAFEPLRALTRLYTNDSIDFEIQLVLARDEVPPFRLGGEAPLPLSWCTWLATKPLGKDADDNVFTL